MSDTPSPGDPREPEPTPEMIDRARELCGGVWLRDEDAIYAAALALATQDALTAARVQEECAQENMELIKWRELKQTDIPLPIDVETICFPFGECRYEKITHWAIFKGPTVRALGRKT